MIVKSCRGAACALALLLGAMSPSAGAQAVFESSFGIDPCTPTEWSLLAGSPFTAGRYDPTPVVTFEGPCAMRAFSVGRYVETDVPASEPVFRARFYFFPQIDGGEVRMLEALDEGGTNVQFAVVYNGDTNVLHLIVGTGAGGPAASLSGVSDLRWHSVEVYYSAGQPMQITTKLVGGAQTQQTTAVNAPSGGIGIVRLGWIASLNNPVGAMNFDAFVSTRSATPIGPLCGGDADGDGALTQADYRALSDEVLRRGIAPGSPECLGDGNLDALDRVCVANAIAAGTCP
jgi:hypothetical protein